MIGVLMSATLPARLGEVARSLVVAGRIGRVRDQLPLVAGTIVSQTVINLLALGILGTVVLATGLMHGSESDLALVTLAPAVALVAGVAATAVVRGARGGGGRALLASASAHLARLRRGLVVFRRPRSGAHAAAAQLGAWGLQLLACYALLVAFGLDERAGLGGAAAVLFAVNATAALPGLPANIGVFQAACVAVLAAHGVGYGPALAYGVALQALELAVAVALGLPAMVAEGVGWRDMRERAVHAAARRRTAPARAYNRRPEIFDFGR
jgi:phosphatidylinositol alpha-mannosyltransferase